VPLITNIKCAKLFISALATIDTAPSCTSVDCQSSLTYELLPDVTDCLVKPVAGLGNFRGHALYLFPF
jgi:carbamoyl-phosphate synthase/aspartate carbamoyltransferase/dihydroorotase